MKYGTLGFKQLELLHFFTNPINISILRALLDYPDGLSITDVKTKCDITKNQAKLRLQKFTTRCYCDVYFDMPKTELQSPTKSYKLIYTLKPSYRPRLFKFIDEIDKIIQYNPS